MSSGAADFLSGLPSHLQQTFTKYANQLIKDYDTVKSVLKTEDGKSIDPFLIKDACFVAFEEDHKVTYLLINPSVQLPDLSRKLNQKHTSLVFLRELKAHSEYLKNKENKDLFAALIGEAALLLLSGRDSLGNQIT
jgi:ssDNA-specific exonuclease RecJ